MIGRGARDWTFQISVIGVGAGQAMLTLSYFVFVSSGRPLDLLKLVIPLFLSFGVIALGVGLLRAETSGPRVVAVAVSGLAGAVLLGVVGWFTLAVQRLEGAAVTDYPYLLLSNVSVGAAVGTLLGVYRVRLQQRTDQLANEVNRLNEFAGIVAHDLRNPLHIAQGYLGELSRDGNEAELTRIERSHARMERLIDHVLALSRRGDAVGETDSVGIESVAMAAWRDVPTGGAELRIASDRRVDADERRLRSLFENLFRNAVEHGSASNRPGDDDAVEHGSTSSRPEADDDGSDVTVTVGPFEDGFYVADDGPGIPPERRERIFEGGYSTDETSTGLGLAIVRQIADAHDWGVAVTESEAGGARFEFAT